MNCIEYLPTHFKLISNLLSFHFCPQKYLTSHLIFTFLPFFQQRKRFICTLNFKNLSHILSKSKEKDRVNFFTSICQTVNQHSASYF